MNDLAALREGETVLTVSRTQMIEELNKFAQLIQAISMVAIATGAFIYWRQLKIMERQFGAAIQESEATRKVNQAGQYQAALQLMFDWRSDIIANPKLADGFKEEPHFRDVFRIAPPERYFHTIKLFHIFEHYWLLHNSGVISDKMWAGWSKNLTLLMQEREIGLIWERVRAAQVFNPDFVAFVEGTVKPIKVAA